MTARAFEAKDLTHPTEPTYDVGAHLGNRRVAHIAALALVAAMAVCLLLAVTLTVEITRNRFVPIPVDLSAGRVVALTGDMVLEDSVLYEPERLIEKAHDYLDLRYAYDYRAGVAKILAAAGMVKAGYADVALSPPADLIVRYNAQETRIALQYDSTHVRFLAKGIFEVSVAGIRHLNNVQYTEAMGPRDTPFKETVFIERVKATPAFPDGLAIRGAKGDLEP